MRNSNIIISVIIVLCIAGGVAAYNIVNPEANIFSLPGYTPSDDGSNPDFEGDGLDTGDTTGDNGNVGTGGSSGGSSSSGSSGGSGTGGSHGGMTGAQAKRIAQNAIAEPGAYDGNPVWDNSIKMWVVKVYDKNGNVIDGIGVDSNGRTNRV
jgi:hypothetical protein